MSETVGSQSPTPPPMQARSTGRCHECGYSLIGLGVSGNCPECGVPFTAETAGRIKPWPSAMSVCVRLGWPLGMLVVAIAMTQIGSTASGGNGDPLVVTGLLLGWASIVAIAINSYFQVKWMLKRSLPNRVRTRGPVAALRALGTTLCVLVLLGFVGLPLAFGIGCLVMLSSGKF